MSNLITKTGSTRRLVTASVLALGVAASILGCSTTQETRHDDASMRGLKPVSCIEMDVICDTPDSGPEQQPVQDNDPDLVRPSKPLTVPSYGEPQYVLESPTAEYPFGGYEGRLIEIPIEQDGNVWSTLDAYNASSPTPLSGEANVKLINNLVAELDLQMEEARDPKLVYAGEVLTIDLTDMPTPNVTTVPPAETFEKPQGAGSSYFDGSDPSMYTNEGPSPVPCDPSWTATCGSNGE